MAKADWESFLVVKKSEKGREVLHVWENAQVVLLHHPEWKNKVRYDTFRQKVFITEDTPTGGKRGQTWTDHDTNRFTDWLLRLKPSIQIGVNQTIIAIHTAARIQQFDSLEMWCDNLPEWDGVPRLDSWLTRYYGAADNSYTRWVGKTFLLAVMMRANQLREEPMKDERFEHHWIMVLEGAQGIAKTTSLRTLFGTERVTECVGTEVGTKDFFMTIQGTLILEFSEFSSLNKGEWDTVKAAMTATVDTFRPPYGREILSFIRRCIFTATVNTNQYLRDETGNRRVNPIICGDAIDLDALRRDALQILSEARTAWRRRSADWWNMPEEVLLIAQGQREAKRISDPWEESCWAFYVRRLMACKTTVDAERMSFVTQEDFFGEHCLSIPMGKRSRADQMRLSSVLRNSLKFGDPTRRKIPGAELRHWQHPSWFEIYNDPIAVRARQN